MKSRFLSKRAAGPWSAALGPRGMSALIRRAYPILFLHACLFWLLAFASSASVWTPVLSTLQRRMWREAGANVPHLLAAVAGHPRASVDHRARVKKNKHSRTQEYLNRRGAVRNQPLGRRICSRYRKAERWPG